MNLAAGATVLAAATIGGLDMAPAHADINNPAINGIFLATSNGEWAKTNNTYHDEASIRSTWTITSSCLNPNTCTGTVSSDEGWTANLVRFSGWWKVVRNRVRRPSSQRLDRTPNRLEYRKIRTRCPALPHCPNQSRQPDPHRGQPVTT